MNLQEIETAAVQRLEAERTAKIEAIKGLAQAADSVADLRKNLVQAESLHTLAYREALKLGWTDADLKHFGIDQPGKKPAGRPRGNKTNLTPRQSEPQNAAQD